MTDRKPRHVHAVYDNNGETFDRYTVPTDYPNTSTGYACLSLSDNPDSPQGFSQWGTCRLGPHLGKEIKWPNLPPEIRRHIIRRLAEEKE